MSGRLLIVNADDFGRSESINGGIVQAHERGIVTSASIMVRLQAARDAAAYAREHGKLGLGLHLDLAEWEVRNGEWRLLYERASTDNPDAVEVTGRASRLQAPTPWKSRWRGMRVAVFAVAIPVLVVLAIVAAKHLSWK